MSTAGLPTIWELVAEAAETLPEPFSRAALINWVSARRPDVGISSIATHIQFATDNAGSTATNPFAGRTPLLHRVDRGLYLRYRPSGAEGGPAAPASGRVVLVGSSGAMVPEPGPAGGRFESSGFARAREHAVHSGLPWFVLSAKHGLLDPDEIVSPYDVQFGDQSVGYRTAWGEWVVAQLGERIRLTGVTVEVHGGVDFAQPLRSPLARRGAALDLPLLGMWQVSAGAAHPDAPRHDGEQSPARAALGRLRGLVSRQRPPEFEPTRSVDASAS